VGEPARFAERVGQRSQLGVVTGRRRQGKTYLLEAVAAEVGGLYFGATQATAAESLAQFSTALGAHLGQPVPLRFADWDEAVTFLFATPQLHTALIVMDEFPYLTSAVPALPGACCCSACSPGRSGPPCGDGRLARTGRPGAITSSTSARATARRTCPRVRMFLSPQSKWLGPG
jgi:hypothetical protein